MILADKIIRLRKKNGWSQEELANKMNVSRQAVSKWESAQSIPDIEKILQLSELFGVTTDYLLKDEFEKEEDSKNISETSTSSFEFTEPVDWVARKRKGKKVLTLVYWLVTTAIYMIWIYIDFHQKNWMSPSWMVWVVAGLLFPCIIVVYDFMVGKNRRGSAKRESK